MLEVALHDWSRNEVSAAKSGVWNLEIRLFKENHAAEVLNMYLEIAALFQIELTDQVLCLLQP